MDDLVQTPASLHRAAEDAARRASTCSSRGCRPWDPAPPTATGCRSCPSASTRSQLAGARPGRRARGLARRLAAGDRRPGRKPGDAHLGRLPGPAAGRRRQRLPLRDHLEPLRQSVARRALPDARGARRAEGAARTCSAPATTTCRAPRFPTRPTCRSARAIEDDVLLVHTWEGAPLPREHGGPVRMITPKLYAWKGTKWIRRIEFLERDQRASGSCAATRTPPSRGSTIATRRNTIDLAVAACGFGYLAPQPELTLH